jgi:cytochrome P450
MLLYPEVQAKAHQEIDTVIGNRLPTMEDRAQLPYLNAVWKETLRWAPPVPLGLSNCKLYHAPINARLVI